MGRGWHFRALLFWLAIMVALYVLIDRNLTRKLAVTVSAGAVEIPCAADGHYYLQGSINGRPLRFMVDSGASSVVVTADFARMAGLPPGLPLRIVTAGGSVGGELLGGQTVEAGGIAVSNIDVAVGLRFDHPDAALLGQSFLRHVEMVQSDDRLILRRREP